MELKKILTIVSGVVIFLFGTIIVYKCAENVDSGEIAVIQSPLSGVLDVYTTPGIKPQMFGSLTSYTKSFQYDFSVKVRFNDGGHANLTGSARIDLPLNTIDMVNLHTRYGSDAAIKENLIGNVIKKSVYMSGTLMSSKESYAEKRNDLINFIADQAEHGVYKTYQKEVKTKDPLSGEEKTVMVVEYIKDSLGNFARQEISPLQSQHIGFSNLSITGMEYESDVEKQIKSQQNLIMQVQTALAKAKQAEQEAITTVKQGEANAAKAKWEQETIKAQAVTEAEQIKEVAKLSADAEEQNKRANILKGEGEAAYKRLVTQANNNLELRLDAAVKINTEYAKAMASSNWVPTYVSGGAGNNSGSGAMDLIHLMTANVASQVGLVNNNPNVLGSGKK